MEEILTEHRKSMAAPAIFILVFSFHFVSRYIESVKKKGAMSDKDVQLRAEIKRLLKEASSLTQPSTFAQAAKLRRMAAAKEKELAKHQEMHEKDMKLSFGTYEKLILISQVVTYLMLILFYWKIPVTTISDQLVRPFGKLLSWRAGTSLKDNVVDFGSIAKICLVRLFKNLVVFGEAGWRIVNLLESYHGWYSPPGLANLSAGKS